MTVGQELTKITKLKLFHNHMTIDVVSDLFENIPKERNRLINLFRKEIFEAYSKSDEYGMIFTYMWAFDRKEDWEYIDYVEKLFSSREARIFSANKTAPSSDVWDINITNSSPPYLTKISDLRMILLTVWADCFNISSPTR